MTTYNTQHAAYVAEGREDEALRAREERANEAADRIADYTADQFDLNGMTEAQLPLQTLLIVRQALAYAAAAGMGEGMPE